MQEMQVQSTPESGRSSGGGNGNPPVFLPGEFHGWWSLMGYSSCLHAQSLQSCLTLCSPMNCNPPGSSVHGFLQARTLEWVAISSSSWSSWPRDQTYVSYIVGRFFIHWATCGKLGPHSWGHNESDTIEHVHACARAHTWTLTPVLGAGGIPTPHWRQGKGLARRRKVDSACTRVSAPRSPSYAASHLNACSNSFLWTRLANALSQALAP